MRVHVLVLPRVELLDLAGPVQVFDAANAAGADYRLRYVAETAQVASAQGLAIGGCIPLDDVAAADLVVIPGLRGAATEVWPAQVLDWVRSAVDVGARIASICAGAFVLAQAGVLDGRRATTHWSLTDRLAAHYPRVHVEEAALFVQDGLITTSAGIASGIDMALFLVEQHHGPLVTAAVARELVVYLRRDGRHDQSSVYLDYRTHLNPAVHKAQDMLLKSFARQVSLDELARSVGTSPRHLTRGFKESTGLTPLGYQQKLRLELAGLLLQDPALTLDVIAARCGFTDARSLRRLWFKEHGAPPSRSRTAGKQSPSQREGSYPLR